VHVLDGLVQVSAHNGGAGVLVPAGVTALVSVSNPGTIRLVDPSTGVGDSRRGQPLDLAPADSSERRADAPSTGVVASLAVPQTIGAAPLDFERLSEGVIKSSITSSTPATVQTIDARGVQTEVLKTDANSNALVDAQADVLRSANNENSAVSSVLAEGKANPIDSIKSGGVVETTIASVGADVSPVINVLPVASPVENGNGNPIISVLPVVENPVENGNGDVSLTPPAIAVGNENGNPVVSVMQSGSPLDGALANPNDNGILGAILSRLPLGK
jgi:hypothetical protein